MIATNINGIFYKMLNCDAILERIKGSVFNGNRPIDRNSEDVCILQISQTGIRPQTGLTYINVHVPDLTVTIEGNTQQIADTARLEALVEIVEQILGASIVGGFAFQIDSKSLVETAIDHYYQLSVSWICASDFGEISKEYYTKAEIDAKFEELKKLILEGKNDGD